MIIPSLTRVSWARWAAVLACIANPAATRAAEPAKAVLLSEFIYEQAPFKSCHASTLAETASGPVAAWFGGTAEKNPDVGIWFARRDGEKWTSPVEVANGVQPKGKRYPCWNPVLFQAPSGPLLLFYKVGPSPSRWWGMMMRSSDGGKSWSRPEELPKGFLGPIKNKPVLLDNGTLLCPSSTEDRGWRIHLERTTDLGRTWNKTGALNSTLDFDAIQPAILRHGNNRLQLLCRSEQDRITECWSEDGGQTWNKMAVTSLPNPNAGIDAVTLADGRHLLVYNHTTRGRTPLNVALSNDGRIWSPTLELETEPGEYSYPAVIQVRDGRVHLSYTWKRERIRYVVLDPKQL